MITRKIVYDILDNNGILYKTSGKNIGTKALAGLNCPFCGDDNGYHLGILDFKGTYFYKCWKNSSHTGSLPYLFSKLLNKSQEECRILLTFDDNNVILFQDEEQVIEERILGGVDDLQFNEEFKNITNIGVYSNFYNYLFNRGYTDIEKLCNRYQLKCTVIGEWAYRIIIPIFYEGKLVSWTGRSILKNPYLRYKDLSISQSVRHIKFNLLDYDYLLNNPTEKLYITEGAFDSFKIASYSINNATSIFTTSMQIEQTEQLYTLSERYNKLYLLLDKDTESQGLQLMSKLSFIKNLKLQYLPDGVKDPGELTKEQVLNLE